MLSLTYDLSGSAMTIQASLSALQRSIEPINNRLELYLPDSRNSEWSNYFILTYRTDTNLHSYSTTGHELQSISEYFNSDYEALWEETTVDIASSISVATPSYNDDMYVEGTGFFIRTEDTLTMTDGPTAKDATTFEISAKSDADHLNPFAWIYDYTSCSSLEPDSDFSTTEYQITRGQELALTWNEPDSITSN